MRRFSALELIELNDRGVCLGPASRAVLLLEAGGLFDRAGAEALPLGARDRWLLALRAVQFGARMDVEHRCSGCGETSEFALTAADLGMDGEPAPTYAPVNSAVRALTVGDLVAVENAPDVEQARLLLRQRAAPDSDALDDEQLDEALAALDPEAELALDLRCPDCGSEQRLILDVPAFLWREIELRVPRVLRQVADIALAYHWSEHDILVMPPARRRFYQTAAGA